LNAKDKEMTEETLEQPEDLVLCPECGAEMDEDDVACPQCGAEFGFYCPECDEEIPAEATVCPQCGAEMDAGFEDDEDAPDGVTEDEPGEAPKREPREDVERATFCADCGEPIDEDDLECPSCGIDLCLDCSSPLDEDDEACPHCGAEFAFSCPDCNADLPADADVCTECGYEFAEDDD
jgi:predicted amidophosphoribosyltransferase